MGDYRIISIISIIMVLTIIIFGITFYLTKIHKNFKKRKFDYNYYYISIINIFISSVIYILIFIFYKNVSTIKFPTILSIISYLLIVDMVYYWIHRIIHRTPFLKQNIHTTHHIAVNLVSSDTFYTDIKEYIIFIFAGFIPFLFMNINITEYIISNIIIGCHSIYIHSERKENFILPLFIDSKYHKYHHHIGKGNYAVLFPIWDDFMKTRIKKIKI